MKLIYMKETVSMMLNRGKVINPDLGKVDVVDKETYYLITNKNDTDKTKEGSTPSEVQPVEGQDKGTDGEPIKS